jgi:hypothetical protein
MKGAAHMASVFVILELPRGSKRFDRQSFDGGRLSLMDHVGQCLIPHPDYRILNGSLSGLFQQ